MDFLKKHYEKIILGVVLLGLAVAVVFIPFKVGSERNQLEEKRKSLIARKVAPLTNIDLAMPEAALKRVGVPVVLNFSTGHRLFTLAAIALVTSLVPLGLTRFGNPEIGERTHFGVRKLFGISPLGVVACFGSGIATPALYALLPSYMVSAGYTTRQLSIVYSFSTIAGLLAQFPVGYLSERLGRRPLMLVASLGAAATAVALYAVGDSSFVMLTALLFLAEGLIAPLYGLGVGQATDYIDKKDFVAASSGLLFAWGLGSAIGPAVAGGLIGLLGPRGLFLFMAGSLALFVLFLVYRMLVRRAKSAKEQLDYVAVPLTQGTYGAPELDPRAEPTSHPHRTIDE